MDVESPLSSHNIAFLEALYEDYEANPASVDPNWRSLIERERARVNGVHPTAHAPSSTPSASMQNGHALPVAEPSPFDVEQAVLQKEVDRLVEHYRLLGHLRADIDPLGRPRSVDSEALDLSYYRLGPQHLDREFYPGRLFESSQVSLRDILAKLQRTYCRRVGVEYWQINDVESRTWLREAMEACENEIVPDTTLQRLLLRSLVRTDAVDRF